MNETQQHNTTPQYTDVFDIDEFQIIEIPKSSIAHINSYSTSKNKQKLLLCTENGVVIVNNHTHKYKLYLNEESPFWLSKLGSKSTLGVKLGSLVDSRSEIAVVPNFTNTNFTQSHLYIFDFQIRCILYKIDTFLRIDNLFITDSKFYASNRKRLLIYDYRNDFVIKNQQFLLNQYFSKQPNTKLRYLQTQCSDYEDPFEKNQQNIKIIKNIQCHCGRFLVSSTSPRIVAYVRTDPMDYLNKAIYIYKQKYGVEEYFVSCNDKAPFSFTLSDDGEFLAYTLKQGTNINIYSINEKKLYCVLYAGMASREIISMDFFKATIQGKDSLCLGMIRRRQQSKGTMHIFKIQMRTPTVVIESQYKRSIDLFQSTFIDREISEKVIGPDFFIHQNVLYVQSLCGIVQEAINFQKGYIKDKKALEDSKLRWQQQQEGV